VLALRGGRVVGVDALIDTLWGRELPSSPRNAIHHHVARLRSALGQECIVGAADGYALQGATVDALRFEDLLAEARAELREGGARSAADAIARGLALWRGPALHGLTDTEWLSSEARRLEALRIDALEEQFEAALALGQQGELVSALRAALEEEPFRERLWGQLMLALYRSGRQADALETFQEARRVLAEGLALEPGPALRRLQEAIFVQDPSIAPVPVAPTRRGNLPAPPSSFVDREQERARLAELLHEHRLVTLVGLPGVGKSRLALEAARALESELEGGVWLVQLERAGSPIDVPRLVAEAVDARGPEPLARVVARLADAHALVVLDGCEQVLGEAARAASAVLAGCPRVRVLATSREVLHIPGEVRFAVAPLALPALDADGADASPAVELFVARARTARPHFELTEEAAPLVAEITRRVDGLPLAIELAAARVNVFGLTQLLSLVERRLGLLHGQPVADEARVALATLVEWSYDLLHADEKTLLQLLAVHRGGAGLESLVALADRQGLDEATVGYLLGALVDKSIVAVTFPGDEARYDLLGTIRQYALERLVESGRLGPVRAVHAEHFASLADAARSELRGPRWRAWIKRLRLENENLWAALTHAREAHDPALAVRLGAGLGLYFTLGERVSEGRRFVELALEASGGAPLAILELAPFLCYLATEELDLAAALAIGERALAVEEIAEAALARGLVQASLALALAESGDRERAGRLGDEARAALEEAGDGWALATGSLLRAMVAAHARDVSTAAAMAADAARHCDEAGFDAFRVPAMLLEAWVAEQVGDSDATGEGYGRALDAAGPAGFPDLAAVARPPRGAKAVRGGGGVEAEELERRALTAAEAAQAPWVAAHARVELGRILTAAGDTETAERLNRVVLEWSARERPRAARESLFVVLAPDPAAEAAAALGELVDARGRTPAARTQA
jgi:predicted ATPase/DNA-binding SARP family transcriptional activator